MKTCAVLKSPIPVIFAVTLCVLYPASVYPIGIGTGVGGLGTGKPGASDESSRFPI